MLTAVALDLTKKRVSAKFGSPRKSLVAAELNHFSTTWRTLLLWQAGVLSDFRGANNS